MNEEKKKPNETKKDGDTSRSSSQGRKLSSGGIMDKRGNPQMDEASKSPTTEVNKQEKEDNKADNS